MGTPSGGLTDLLAARERKRRRFVGGLNVVVFALTGVVGFALLDNLTQDEKIWVAAGLVGWCLLHILGGLGFAFGRRWSVLVLWPVSIIDLAVFPWLTLLGGYNLWVLYDTREQTATSARALVIASVIPVVLLVSVLSQRFSSETPYSRYARLVRAAIEAQGGTREFQQWLEAARYDTVVSTPQVERGLVRLGVEDQFTYLRLKVDRLGHLPVRDCAAIARGTATEVQKAALLEGLDSTALRQLVEVSARALLAELRDSPAPVMASDSDIAEYYDRIIPDGLSQADRRRFHAAAHESPATVSDADACWAAQVVNGRAVTSDPARERWLRVAATMMARSTQ